MLSLDDMHCRWQITLFKKKNCSGVAIIRNARHVPELREKVKDVGLCQVCGVAMSTSVRHWVDTIVCTLQAARRCKYNILMKKAMTFCRLWGWSRGPLCSPVRWPGTEGTCCHPWSASDYTISLSHSPHPASPGTVSDGESRVTTKSLSWTHSALCKTDFYGVHWIHWVIRAAVYVPPLKKCQCLDLHAGTVMAAHADRSSVKSGTSREHLSVPPHLILHWLNGNTGEEQQAQPDKTSSRMKTTLCSWWTPLFLNLAKLLLAISSVLNLFTEMLLSVFFNRLPTFWTRH